MNRHLTILTSDATSMCAGPVLDAAVAPSPPLKSTELGSFRFGSKLEMRIVKKLGRAVGEWRLLEAGDRVMVCISGGKDSYALLDALLLWRRYAPFDFEVFAVNLDQGWPAYDTARIEEHLKTRAVEYHMLREGIASIVEAKLAPDATPCSLCSRLRRGVLYNAAVRLGATKIALGHHLDDLCETLMLNLLYSGQLKSMPPRLVSDDGRNVVVRPFAYVEERDLIAYAKEQQYPTVRCSCPTCGLPDQKRQVVKRMLAAMAEEHPGLKTQMLAAMKNVKPGHLLDQDLLAALGGPAFVDGRDRSESPGWGRAGSEQPS